MTQLHDSNKKKGDELLDEHKISIKQIGEWKNERGRGKREKGGKERELGVCWGWGDPRMALLKTLWNYLAATFIKAFVDLHNDPVQFFPIKKIPTNKKLF